MPVSPVISRIDRSLLLLERKDVAFVSAARATFVNVLRKLRELEKKVKAIKKQHKHDFDYAADSAIRVAVETTVSPMYTSDGVTGWFFATGSGSKLVEYPDGVPKNPLTVCFERPHAGNRRYAGVYLDYGNQPSGGMVKIVLPGTYTPEQFADPKWFALNAADIFDQQDSIFVHEITHYFDTMRAKDHAGYQKSGAPGRKAFWDTPEDKPTPDAYFLGNEEVNARFNEFVSAQIRQMDLNAISAADDYKVLSDAAAQAGKTWTEFTGSDAPIEFLRDRLFRSTFYAATPARFVEYADKMFDHLGGFNHTWRLLKQDKTRWRKMVGRMTQLHADLTARAERMAQAILKKKRLNVSMKSKRTTVTRVDPTTGRKSKMSAVRYVHKT